MCRATTDARFAMVPTIAVTIAVRAEGAGSIGRPCRIALALGLPAREPPSGRATLSSGMGASGTPRGSLRAREISDVPSAIARGSLGSDVPRFRSVAVVAEGKGLSVSIVARLASVGFARAALSVGLPETGLPMVLESLGFPVAGLSVLLDG